MILVNVHVLGRTMDTGLSHFSEAFRLSFLRNWHLTRGLTKRTFIQDGKARTFMTRERGFRGRLPFRRDLAPRRAVRCRDSVNGRRTAVGTYMGRIAQVFGQRSPFLFVEDYQMIEGTRIRPELAATVGRWAYLDCQCTVDLSAVAKAIVARQQENLDMLRKMGLWFPTAQTVGPLR